MSFPRMRGSAVGRHKVPAQATGMHIPSAGSGHDPPLRAARSRSDRYAPARTPFTRRKCSTLPTGPASRTRSARSPVPPCRCRTRRGTQRRRACGPQELACGLRPMGATGPATAATARLLLAFERGLACFARRGGWAGCGVEAPVISRAKARPTSKLRIRLGRATAPLFSRRPSADRSVTQGAHVIASSAP